MTIHDVLDHVNSPSDGSLDVLTTIIKVDGSAYRKEGTTMLVKSDGNRIGLLSAGCLEEDLTARIQSKTLNQESETLIYDLSSEDDLSWGQGAGCNGSLYILLEPINDSFYLDLLNLKNYLNKGLSVQLIRKLNANYKLIDYLFIVENGVIFGDWSNGVQTDIEHLVCEKGIEKNKLIANQDGTCYYVQTFQPKPKLILFGAGEDAIPLAKLAFETGFSVSVTDWRPGLCNRNYFPFAEHLVVGSPSHIISNLTFSPQDCVIILSHVFQKDKEFLTLLKDKNLGYIGILGSKKRTTRLLDGIGPIQNIYSPVGLSIGADGPAEIAVSITAELIKHVHLSNSMSHTS